MNRLFLIGILCLMAISFLNAEGLNTPAPSPSATVTQIVGLTEVTVSYSRPGVKGREIFGGLTPFDELWRTGANKSTTVKFSDDVKLEGNHVPAGEYALFTIPGEKEWTVIISKSIGSGSSDYKKEDDVARFTVASKKLPESVERFTIELADMTNESANFVLRWAKTQVSFGMMVDTDSKVMAQIDEIMKNRDLKDPEAYHSAADYYFSTGKDLKKALTWSSKAVELKPEAFWMIRLKSQIQAKMGDYKAAVKTAELSMKEAQKANYQPYIKMNQEAIAEWKKKL